MIEGHHAGNDAQYTHKNPFQPSPQLLMCSAPLLGCAAGSPPALRLVAGEGLGAGHLLCFTAPLLPVSAGTWELQKSFTSLLWPCTYRSYQPLLEGTVSHEDPHTAAQHLMHPGVGEVLWLCWLPLDLAERPDFVTSKGFSLPKMRGKKREKESQVGSDAR